MFDPDPLARQQTAAVIRRGLVRLLHDSGFAAVAELPLGSGRRADVVALGPGAEIWVVEIKSSAADFRADRKWPEYRLHCDRLLFAVNAEFPAEILPASAGLVVADGYGGALIRRGDEHRLGAASRKAMLVRIARAAASRLGAIHDPGLGELDLR
jgi:hypothetical protein